MTSEPYTGDETRIILSFAMKNGGHLFSKWLRDQLMLSLNYFSPNSIYVDTVALREYETEHNLIQVNPGDQQPGMTYVAPDRRFEKQEGYTIIGAMNKGWNESFLKAISEALVMIFLLTRDYTSSQWCMQELNQFHEENKKRVKAKRIPIFGLAIRFSSEIDGSTQECSESINLGRMKVLNVPKIKTTQGSTALGRDGTGWAISEKSYLEILKTIRPHL